MGPVAALYETLGDFFTAFWSIEILVQLTVPIVMLAWGLPRRPWAALRLAVVVGALCLVGIVPLATGLVTSLDSVQAFWVFSGLLVIFVCAIAFVCDVGPWTALACATSAYTLQNLASGLIILVRIVGTGRAAEELDEPWRLLVRVLVPAAVYVAGYVLFVRRVGRNGLLFVENRLIVLMLVAVVVIIIGLDLLIKQVALDGVRFSTLVLFRTVFPMVCVFVLFCEYELLYSKRMSDEKAETEALLAERERQYQLSRANIDAINIKCHDIRHQIRQLGESGAVVDVAVLADIEREVNIYDSVVETGNEALDTILTEKSLACSARGIVLGVIADGDALGFMGASDTYSLFGNMLDNAIEATQLVSDPERRTISLSVTRQGAMVAVSAENYFEPGHEPRFVGGLPRSSKGDDANHGFGTRSMRATVERYGGTFHVGAEHGVYYLNALLPVPE